MANEYTPTQAAVWIHEVWEPEIGIAAYEEMVVAKEFLELQPIQGKLHFTKHANLGRNTLGAAVAGSNLSFSGNTEVEVTTTPQTSYVAVEVNMNVIARMINDPTDVFRRSIEMSIAEGVDIECAKRFDDLVSVLGGGAANVTEATFLDGLVSLAETAKMYFKPGQTRARFIFHPRQIDDVLASTQNWAQYQISGQKDGPVSTGWLKAVYGCDFLETGNIQSIAGAYHNGLFLPKVTFGIGYNQKPTVKMEEYLLAKRIIGWCDFGTITRWDGYGSDYQSTTAA